MKLVCANGHEYKSRRHKVERDELTCDECGGKRGTPSQMRRREIPRVSAKRQAEDKAKGRKRYSTTRRSQPDRDWALARAKVEDEGCCRVCGVDVLELLVAAHTIGRKCDRLTLDGDPVDTKRWKVEPDRIVTLCRSRDRVKGCHEQYDDYELSILPVLRLHKQVQAVRDAGGLELARKRLSPTDYESGVARRLAA